MPFATIDVTKGITGTIPVANGGTGLTSGTTGEFLKFTGSTAIGTGEAGGGKIGQVVHTKNTTYRLVQTSSLVECISVTITPSATSSKILVLNSALLGKADNNTKIIEKMFRNVGGVDTATQVLSDISAATGDTSVNHIGFSTSQFYDTPSTTSAITYTYNIASYNNNAQVNYNNYNAAGSFSSQMTAMEILA